MFRLQKKQTLARARGMAHGNPRDGTWEPAGWHMETRWMAHGNPLDGTWKPDRWHMGAGGQAFAGHDG